MTATILSGGPAAFAAPIGFGDSLGGDPVVGTTAEFVDHLSAGLAAGQPFARLNEAVVGALSPHEIGDNLEIHHGSSDGPTGDADNALEGSEHHNGEEAHAHDEHSSGEKAHADNPGGHADGGSHETHNEHEHQPVTVVGRMRATGTPWDRAIVVPIEYNWSVHGFGTGHVAGDSGIGPPFDTAKLPGVPAIVIKPGSVASAYGLRDRYRTIESTAFFPAEVLVEMYSVMGNVVSVMSGLTLASQVLVVAAILAGVLALLDLQRQRFAVLRALGAPRAFIFATVWLYVVFLISAGALIGLPLGWLLAVIVSAIVSGHTRMAMHASLGPPEFAMVGLLLACGLALAVIPALLIYRRPVAEALRS
jgi:putative ABC transport system permease protein